MPGDVNLAEVVAHLSRTLPEDAIMIGNSMKSDILPVLAAGGAAIHIPYEITWVHEMVDQTELENQNVLTAESISDVPGMIEQLEQHRTAGSMEHV